MAAIDSTPLSASSIERRNSLEKHLQLRPEAQDLRNRHILLGEEVAPYVFPSCLLPPVFCLQENNIWTNYAGANM